MLGEKQLPSQQTRCGSAQHGDGGGGGGAGGGSSQQLGVGEQRVVRSCSSVMQAVMQQIGASSVQHSSGARGGVGGSGGEGAGGGKFSSSGQPQRLLSQGTKNTVLGEKQLPSQQTRCGSAQHGDGGGGGGTTGGGSTGAGGSSQQRGG